MERKEHHCISCGKRFFEKNTFLPKYYRMTNRLAFYVLDKLRNEHSFTSVAREVNLSVTTVIRIFDMITYSKPKTSPIALSIDEFKGNTSCEKYQCIIADPVNKVVLDILPQRYSHYRTSYFKSYPKQTRNQVKYFVSDMWRTYSNSFSSTISNGFIEGCNNKIKVLKRSAYGYQNFKRFRNQILHMFSHQHPTKKQAVA